MSAGQDVSENPWLLKCLRLTTAAAGLAPDEAPKAAAGSEAYDEVLAALVMLGFARAAADKAVTAVLKEEPALSVEETVRRALKRL